LAGFLIYFLTRPREFFEFFSKEALFSIFYYIRVDLDLGHPRYYFEVWNEFIKAILSDSWEEVY